MNRSNWIIYTFVILILLILGGGIYWMRSIQKTQRELYEQMRSFQFAQLPAVEISKQDSQQDQIAGTQKWSDLQDKVKNAVVQVFSQVGTIDLLQPYKTPNQYQGTGSGFFINKEGEIITNAHVIDQAKAIWIQIPGLGKQQIDVELVGVSPERDLALLRVPQEGMETIKTVLGEIPYLELGNSNDVKRADEIMTLGYPLGQQGLKSTVGVVSGREQHLIQIDAAINPGNSGGPSIDPLCHVIGVNTLYAPDAQNVGFIIPINQLKIVLDDLRSVKLLRKPFLGIIFNNGSESLTNYLGNPQPGGLYVVDVYKGSPLAKAGVKRGDMVYEINNHKLDMYGEMFWQGEKVALIDYVSQMKLGQEVSLVVYRKGKRKEISLTFEQTELLPIRHIYPGFEKIDYEVTAGMVVQPLTINHLPILVNQAPALAKYAEMKYQMEPALIITHIFPDSQAHRSRSLMPGSILKEVNGEAVKTMSDYRRALERGISTGDLTVETNEGVFVVCPFKKVLEEQVRLAREYFFPISDTTKVLLVQAEKRSWFKVQKDEFLFAQAPGIIPIDQQNQITA
jgi:serine protease Do